MKLRKGLSICCLASAVILLASPVHSQSFEEGFEDGSVSDWYASYGGGWDTFEASTAESYEGSYSLHAKFSGDGGGDTMLNLPKTYQPEKLSFRAKLIDPGADDLGFSFIYDGERWLMGNFDDEVNNDIEVWTNQQDRNDGGGGMGSGWYKFVFDNPEGGNVDYQIIDGSGNVQKTGSAPYGPNKINQLRVWHASYSSSFSGEFYIDNIKIYGQNNAPNNPSSPSPNDGASGVSTSPSISAFYSDPDGDSGTLKYYTGGGSFIDSCGVSDGSRCSVTYSGASSSGTTYNWYAVAEDNNGASSGQSSTWSFTTNYAPDNPSNPSPSDGADPVELSPTLNVDVSDPDGDNLDVTFKVDKNNDGTHGTTLSDNNVNSGDPASVSLSNLATSQTVDWYVEISDDSETTTSSEFSFTTVGKPSITSGTASPTGIEVSKSADLQVDVNHPDNLDMDVQFTMDGNNVGSDTVTGGSGTASVIPSSPSLGYSEDRSWSVDIDTQGYSTSTSGGTYTFETVHDVYTQSISGPSKSPASINPTLEATVSHSDPNEQVTVNFVNADTGNTISGCSKSGIGNGQTATCDTSGASFGSSPGTTYNWRVETSGGQPSESFTSSQLSFTTISKPDSPSLVNPSPSGTSGVDTANNLRVDVTHPDNENMDVTFRVDENADGNYDQSITKTGIASGDTASANPSLTTGTTYDWYAEVDTADYTTSNSNAANPYSFTTNYGPAVDSVSATDSSSGHAFSSVYGIVSDPDGASDISSATLTVDDGDGNTNSYSSTSIDTSAGTSNEANVTFGSVSYTDVAGWSGNENMQLKIQTTDNDGRSALKDTTRKFPNHAPVVETGFSYTDDPNNHAFTLSIEASDVDAGSSEIASCNVEHSDGTNSFSTSGNLITGEPKSTCKLRIDTSFTGYQKGDVISHNVTFTDQHGKSVTSSTDTHMIPNTAPTASNLEPSSSGVEYGPTIKATYNDDDGDTGSLTFYDSDSGAQIGSKTGLSPGEVAEVGWSSADTPGTTYNFTVEASDGLNATNTSEDFTTIYQPQVPYDPFPANNKVVDTTGGSGSGTAVSVKVKHPDDREMAVRFINATDDSLIDVVYPVESGTRAKLPNSQTDLRDATNTTYSWYAESVDRNTYPNQVETSGVFNFTTLTVGEVNFEFLAGRDENGDENVDITGEANNGNEEIRINVTSTLFDEVPRISINRTSDMSAVKTWTDVSNNSVITVDVVQDGGQEWDLQLDREYEWFIEAYDGPNEIRTRGNFSLYTYNTSIRWDRAQKYYNVYEYDVYRAPVTGGDTGAFELVGNTANTKFMDAGPGLAKGQEFCWKVAASNPSGESTRIPDEDLEGLRNDGACKTLN